MNNDITFCINDSCPVKHQYRRGQEPTKSVVSVAKFEYDLVEDSNEIICSGFWRLENDRHK
jgi:hypothetical protein